MAPIREVPCTPHYPRTSAGEGRERPPPPPPIGGLSQPGVPSNQPKPKASAPVLPQPKTMFVGMGPDAKKEAEAMKKGFGNIDFIGSAADNDTITTPVNGKDVKFNLRDKQGRQDFVDTAFNPPLSAEQKTAVLEALDQGYGSKDEVAKMALGWHECNSSGGAKTLDNLVFSGHSRLATGSSVYNGSNGSLEMASIGALAKAFPEAAKQVKTVFFAACNHLHPKHVTQLKQWFPNLQAAGGYSGTAPATNIGGSTQAKAWSELVQEGKFPITRQMVMDKLEQYRKAAKPGDPDAYAMSNAINFTTWNKVDDTRRNWTNDPTSYEKSR